MKVHSFYIDEAEKHGVEKAVILYNLRFWLEKNKANGTNKHEGYYWTYNSAKAFSDLFPYFKERKISRLLKQLEDDGHIISGCFNKKGYDRTKWYTLPDFTVEKADKAPQTLGAVPLVNSDKWISQNCLMDLSIPTNGYVNSDRPIPDSKPDSKPDDVKQKTNSNEIALDDAVNHLKVSAVLPAFAEVNKTELKTELYKFNQYYIGIGHPEKANPKNLVSWFQSIKADDRKRFTTVDKTKAPDNAPQVDLSKRFAHLN